jgi:hypothetical protein
MIHSTYSAAAAKSRAMNPSGKVSSRAFSCFFLRAQQEKPKKKV